LDVPELGYQGKVIQCLYALRLCMLLFHLCFAEEARLNHLAAVGGGKYYRAVLGTDLILTFRGIATRSPLLQELVESFGEQVSKLITEKLVLEYL
jgi:hypothetical protein